MTSLLDTHLLLSAVSDPDRLSKECQRYAAGYFGNIR